MVRTPASIVFFERDSARSGRAMSESSALTGAGQPAFLKARGDVGFTRHGTGPTSGHLSLRNNLWEPTDKPIPSDAPV
jgi:hypothetical protein